MYGFTCTDSDERIVALFGMQNRTLEGKINSVPENHLQTYVPNHSERGHVSGEELIQRNSYLEE